MSLLETAKQLSEIFLLKFKFASFGSAHAPFPWNHNRYSHGVQFGINCVLGQSEMFNLFRCTINLYIDNSPRFIPYKSSFIATSLFVEAVTLQKTKNKTKIFKNCYPPFPSMTSFSILHLNAT